MWTPIFQRYRARTDQIPESPGATHNSEASAAAAARLDLLATSPMAAVALESPSTALTQSPTPTPHRKRRASSVLGNSPDLSLLTPRVTKRARSVDISSPSTSTHEQKQQQQQNGGNPEDKVKNFGHIEEEEGEEKEEEAGENNGRGLYAVSHICGHVVVRNGEEEPYFGLEVVWEGAEETSVEPEQELLDSVPHLVWSYWAGVKAAELRARKGGDGDDGRHDVGASGARGNRKRGYGGRTHRDPTAMLLGRQRLAQENNVPDYIVAILEYRVAEGPEGKKETKTKKGKRGRPRKERAEGTKQEVDREDVESGPDRGIAKELRVQWLGYSPAAGDTEWMSQSRAEELAPELVQEYTAEHGIS